MSLYLLYLSLLCHYFKIISLFHFLALLISFPLSNMPSTMPVLCDSLYWNVLLGWLFLFSSVLLVSFHVFLLFGNHIISFIWHTSHHSMFSPQCSFREAIASIIKNPCFKLKGYFPLFGANTSFIRACFLPLWRYFTPPFLPLPNGVLHRGDDFIF